MTYFAYYPYTLYLLYINIYVSIYIYIYTQGRIQDFLEGGADFRKIFQNFDDLFFFFLGRPN